jgi:glycosyltransferase involved in cell wall biosynthesis
LSIKQFYPGQIQELIGAGFAPVVICADDPQLNQLLPQSTRYIPVNFKRTISPLGDIRVIFKLIHLFRKEHFDIVQYSTPKASLLGSIASFFARVPLRIYILWGLYYTGQEGLGKFVLKGFEKLICRLSTYVVPISHEMIDFAEAEGLVHKQKCHVMLNGSACGVDLETFDPAKWAKCHDEIRDKYNIPAHAIVIGTVARLTGDKGINELVKAFDTLSQERAGIYLLLVGEQEEKDRLLQSTERIINDNNRIRIAGWQDDPKPFYVAMDIFCLPTYREGFGEVNLEAQAMGLPVVSTDVIGPRESVENGSTGFLVEPKSAEALIAPLKTLINNAELRKKMGSAGRLRVEKMFDRKDIIKAVVQHRLQLLSKLRKK